MLAVAHQSKYHWWWALSNDLSKHTSTSSINVWVYSDALQLHQSVHPCLFLRKVK